jgi:CBS domain-containing protein
MPPARPTPFDAVFGPLAAARFPAIREGLAAAGQDPRVRDGFLLVREVVELLRDFRPEEGLGEAVAALAALVHHAYLYWMDGARVGVVGERALESALTEGRKDGKTESGSTEDLPSFRPSVFPSVYIQLPPLAVWGAPVAGAPPEPLDGWFLSREGDRITLLAIFGLHPGRAGLTTVETAGPRPGPLRRPDGSALFAPLLDGAAAAGLRSVAGEEELLELAWRVESGPLPSSSIPPAARAARAESPA